MSTLTLWHSVENLNARHFKTECLPVVRIAIRSGLPPVVVTRMMGMALALRWKGMVLSWERPFQTVGVWCQWRGHSACGWFHGGKDVRSNPMKRQRLLLSQRLPLPQQWQRPLEMISQMTLTTRRLPRRRRKRPSRGNQQRKVLGQAAVTTAFCSLMC